MRKHQVSHVSPLTGKKDSMRGKSPIVSRSRKDDFVAKSSLTNKKLTVSSAKSLLSNKELTVSSAPAQGSSLYDINVQLKTSESSNSTSTHDLSPELELQQNTATSRQSPKTSHDTSTSKKQVQELNMLKISTYSHPESLKNPSIENDKKGNEKKIPKETNHQKLLMRWEKDLTLGSKARTAPMLYMLEKMPEELAAVKGLI